MRFRGVGSTSVSRAISGYWALVDKSALECDFRIASAGTD
jgi:hypothetical protein